VSCLPLALAAVMMALTAQAPQGPRAATSGTQPADTRLNEAFRALYANDPDRALQRASEYVKQYPTDVKGLVLAARAHLARNEPEASYDLLQQALGAHPRNADVLYFLGIVSSRLATREFDRLYALAPDSARVHQLMAKSLKLQDKLAEAADEYELALRANPNLLEAVLELADLRREESKCDEAAVLYQRAQTMKSTYDGAYGLGVCLAMQNEQTRAVEQFRSALKLDPQSAVAHFGLGGSLLQLGDVAPAVRALERAVALEPRMRQAYYLLGRAYSVIGSPERSRKAFARADELARAERAGDEKALGLHPPRRRLPDQPRRP
jgi:tetratricopeptide (TPR) repeat protein